MYLPFDSKETETRRGVTCPGSLGGGNPETIGSRLPGPAAPLPPPPPSQNPGTAPPPWVLVNPVRAALGADRSHRENEGSAGISSPRPRTCRSLGSRQSPASGTSRERRPASPAPTAGRQAEQRPGTAPPPARRKWLRAGRACRAHAPARGLGGRLRDLWGGGWVGAAGGRGREVGRSLRPARHVSQRTDLWTVDGWPKPFLFLFFFLKGGGGGEMVAEVGGACWLKRNHPIGAVGTACAVRFRNPKAVSAPGRSGVSVPLPASQSHCTVHDRVVTV